MKALLPVCLRLKRQYQEFVPPAPTMAIEELENSFTSTEQGRAVREAIKRLSNPQSERDREAAKCLGQMQEQIEWLYPFSDGIFEHIN